MVVFPRITYCNTHTYRKGNFEGGGIEYSPLRFLCVHLQRFEFDYLDWLVFGVFFHFFCGKGNKKCNWIKSMAQYP